MFRLPLLDNLAYSLLAEKTMNLSTTAVLRWCVLPPRNFMQFRERFVQCPFCFPLEKVSILLCLKNLNYAGVIRVEVD